MTDLTYAAGDTVTLQGDRRERPIKPRAWVIVGPTSCGRSYVIRRVDDNKSARWECEAGLVNSGRSRLLTGVVVV